MPADLTKPTFDAWMRREVLPAIRMLGQYSNNFFGLRGVQAMLLAMITQECRARSYDGPSTLAWRYHNLGGIKWTPGDKGRYEWVEMAPNEFETARQRYRIYRSIEHCLDNMRWHLIFSEYYRGLVHADEREWLRGVGPVWCGVNPQHTESLLKIFDEWLERLDDEEAAR